MKYLFVALVLGSIFISYKANKYPAKLFWSDMEGYYIYLPATFIYGGFDKVKVADKEYLKPFSETNSKIYTKYTCGVALMEAPFFLVAHFLSKPLGFASDGHSLPYSYGIMLAGLFYFWLGIFYLYKFLVKNTFKEYIQRIHSKNTFKEYIQRIHSTFFFVGARFYCAGD